MKKVFLSLAVIASVSLFACGNKENKEAEAVCEDEATELTEAEPAVEAEEVTEEGVEVATTEGEEAVAEATEVVETPAE